MKRGILLIVALLLVLDLAEDGYLGRAKFVPPHSSAKTSLTSSPQFDSAKIDSSDLPPSQNWAKIPCPRQVQPVMQPAQQSLKITTYCNNGSSGGMPR